MRGAALPLLVGVVLAASPAFAKTWPEAKCTRYRQAWSGWVQARGTGGLGREFLAATDAFLASGCTSQGAVCPRSAAELAAADAMTVVMMNYGTASTFLPFGCR